MIAAGTGGGTGSKVDVLGPTLEAFLGYGVISGCVLILGLVVWLLWRNDQADTTATLQRERERADAAEERAAKAEAANADLNREVRDKVVPALVESTRATTEVVRLLDRRDR